MNSTQEEMKRISIQLPASLVEQLTEGNFDSDTFLSQSHGVSIKNRSETIEGLIQYALINPPKTEAETETEDFLPKAPEVNDAKLDGKNKAPIMTRYVKPVTELVGDVPDQPLHQRAIARLESDRLSYFLTDCTLDIADIIKCGNLSVQQIMQRHNLDAQSANRVLLAYEFAKRMAMHHTDKERVTQPKDIADYLMPHLRDLKHEVVIALALDTKGGVTDSLKIAEESEFSINGSIYDENIIFEGCLNQTVFHPREIFRFAINACANSIVLAHNHPSGDPQPSQEDIRATKQLIEAGDYVGIKILDHVIIGDGIYHSMKEGGEI